ncbi:hypothetical protein BB14905_18195 [Bacillus sp. B14905]|nr:hypothetical protein BB14905_18195 [Bacillus sp. B14905]
MSLSKQKKMPPPKGESLKNGGNFIPPVY